MRPFVGFALVLASTTLGAGAAAADGTGDDNASLESHYRHRGFFFRPELGIGYLTASEPTGTSLGNLNVKAAAGTAGLALGGAITDNVILAAHLYDSVAVNPSVSFTSGPSGTSSATLTGFGFGPEVDFYVMPSNVFLSATVAVTTLSVSVNGTSVSYSAGPGGRLGIGKEWFAGSSWGLGVMATASYASNADTNGSNMGTWLFALSFTATYNRFRDDAEPAEEVHAPASVREDQEARDFAPPPAPAKDLTSCGQAFDHIDALADAWTDWNPGRAPRGDAPTRKEFLSVCGDLPQDVQDCLDVSYGKAHRPECSAAIDQLPRRARYRLDGLFLQPPPPAPPAASP